MAKPSETPVDLPRLIKAIDKQAGTNDVLERLKAAVDVAQDLNGMADALLDHYVEMARNLGHSWTDIGIAIGVSKQAAQQRFVAPPTVNTAMFTDRGRKVLVLAQQEATERHADYVGVEHLVVGLVREGAGVAGVVLKELGVTLDALRERIRSHTGPDPEATPSSQHYSPRAKRLITDLVIREALQLGHNYVGTEHILLAVCTQGDSLGALILTEEVEGGLAAIRAKVMEKLAGYTKK